MSGDDVDEICEKPTDDPPPGPTEEPRDSPKLTTEYMLACLCTIFDLLPCNQFVLINRPCQHPPSLEIPSRL